MLNKRRLRKKRIISLAAGVTLLLGINAALADGFMTAGPKPNGTAITPNGWMITPAGSQLGLGDLPLGGAMSPNHHYLVVSNDGEGTQSLQVIDLFTHQVVQTLKYQSPQALFLGVAFSPDGKTLYASAGGNNEIRVYSFANGHLAEQSPLSLTASITSSGTPAATPAPSDPYPAGLSVSPDGHYLYVADDVSDSVTKVDTRTGKIVATTAVGHNPYMALVNQAGNKLYVTNWGASTVTVLNTSSMTVLKTIQVGLHPSAIVQNPVTGDLYVANTDEDTISAINPSSDSVVKTISVSPFKGAPVGTQPDALAVSQDGQTLYVANAGNNDVAVVKLSAKTEDHGFGLARYLGMSPNKGNPGIDTSDSVTGLIPTGWYPTGVYLDPATSQVLVLNGKGLGAGPNANGQYIADMIQGTLSAIPVPGREQLKKDTAQVWNNNHFSRMQGNGLLRAATVDNAPLPLTPASHSPIKHVIYVIKENQTYDQILGDLGKGNGDPALTLYGWNITPNIHALANDFVTLDNFYADSEVSAQGHNWTTAGESNTYVEKNWPATYANRNRGYDYEGGNPSTSPLNGYIWDDAARAGVSFRDYGEFYAYKKNYPADPGIGNHYDPNYAGYNLSISDLTRAAAWQTEFNQFVKNHNLPQLEVVRLPNDHTAGTTPGQLSPDAMEAQNDYALGKIVDAVSHSEYWRDTAIFVVEDEAQNGRDHVDAHRTEALVISPYTQTGKVDSTFYDQASMLRTIELILDMKPMTQFDASATPMVNSFTNHPNFSPYNVVAPSNSLLNQTNP